jgi:hypothetical protein
MTTNLRPTLFAVLSFATACQTASSSGSSASAPPAATPSAAPTGPASWDVAAGYRWEVYAPTNMARGAHRPDAAGNGRRDDVPFPDAG